MEHVVVDCKHQLRDILKYSKAVEVMRRLLTEANAGECLHDDVAIDGGDAEAFFRGKSPRSCFTQFCLY